MTKISKVNYYIETGSISKKIILLTDLHYYSEKDIKKLNKVYNALYEENFDYICISGDVIDVGSIRDMDVFINWLTKLAGLKKVMMSLGGHDIVRAKKNSEYYYNEEFYNRVKNIKNLYLLDNEVYEEEDIRFIGITLPVDFYYKYNENNNYFKRFVNNTFETFEDKYNVLLCHTPIPFTSLDSYDDIKLLKNIQLVLCGHMHGGIVPKFLRNKMKGTGIFAPHGKKMFPKNTYGLIKRNNLNIVISTGVTKASNTNPFKFTDIFFDKEITIVNLKDKYE